MPKLRIDYDQCPSRIAAGLREIQTDRSRHFTNSSRAVTVRFTEESQSGRPRFSILKNRNVVTVHYSRPCEAFRALGHLLGRLELHKPIEDFTQQNYFDLLGVLLDFSRNGVATLDTAKQLLRQMASLGFNAFMPYMEDTFEVPGEPFFGYLRGRYTAKDLKEIDDYAHNLGIEVFCSIQVLGHVQQILQWPVYANLRDVPGVMLAEHEPTYELVEKMIRAASEPVRSKRFFPGMDEAHGLGTGRYRRLIGDKRPFDILNSYMRRVVGICRKLGLTPMTSSDMYFRLGSKKNEYYDPETVIPKDVIDDIPPEMQLIYWDYYHTDSAFYKDWIDRHRGLKKEPMMFGGVWTWSHFWAQLPFSFVATDALMKACKIKGLRENLVTLWGDDGMQCDPFSALPGLAHYAEHAYSDSIDEQHMRDQMRGASGADFDDFVRASDIDRLNSETDQKKVPNNPSTWLLWEDPMLGLLGPEVRNASELAEHHRRLADDLFKRAAKPGMSKRLRFPAQIARVLSLKVNLHPNLAAAIKNRDKDAVRSILKDQVKPLQREVDRLWLIHREMWLATYRPFGLEVLECRYGGLRTRLQSLADRLKDFVDGKIDSIPEFETKLQRIFPEADIYAMIEYGRASTASAAR